jgi:hypothetical protein
MKIRNMFDAMTITKKSILPIHVKFAIIVDIKGVLSYDTRLCVGKYQYSDGAEL